MIVLLLNSSNLLLGQTNDNVPSTGRVLQSDTTDVKVPIYLIKQANAKMIERLYLIKINNQQDSIIDMKDKYIREQKDIIVDFQKRVNEVNRLNQKIKDDLNKQKRKNTIITCGACAIILGLAIDLIAK